MKRRAFFIISLIAMAYLSFSCSGDGPTGPTERFKGSLKILIVDSFHINESTASLNADVRYSIAHESGYFNDGNQVIDSTSMVGRSFALNLDSIPAGNYSATFHVDRPFVILGPKDATESARFSDIKTIAVPIDSAVAMPPVEIWAYRLNRLVVYFEQNVSFDQADSIVGDAGVEIISRSRSFLDEAPLYRVGTNDAGTEVEIKSLVEGLPGVQAVFYDIYGHSYF